MFNTKNSVVGSAVVAAFVGLSGFAEAATISLSPLDQDVVQGDAFGVKLNFDFTGGSAVLGGGIDVFYNSSIIDFVSFTINPAINSDAAFTRVPDDMTNEINGISFGNFSGYSGTGLIGTLNFKALAPGETSLTMANNDLPAGAFFDLVGNKVAMNYQGAHVTVQPIPLPAAVWLLGSGLAGLGMFRTRRRRS
jgi:hypothetical protein